MISGRTVCAPADVDYDGSRIDALDRHFQRLIDGKQLQAANYCVSRDGKVFANNAIGKLSFRQDDPREMRPDTVQWIASITKIICAAAIFRLVEDGQIRLNQCAGEILKEMSVPPYKDITLAQLLSHTSGLAPDPGCFENKYQKPAWYYIATMKKTNWLEAGLSVGMRSKPSAEWAYCTFGFTILGEVISRASGMNVHDFIRKEILRPCGMADTEFGARKPVTDAERDVRVEFFKRLAIRNEEEEKEIADVLAGREEKPSSFDILPYTGFGVLSITEDLVKFGNMLLNGGTTLEGKRVLGRRTVARMTETYTGPEIRDYTWNSGGVYRPYALGPDRRRNADNLYSPSFYFHEGSGGCALVIDPEERMVGSWFVPFVNGVWSPAAIYNSGAVIWSGLK